MQRDRMKKIKKANVLLFDSHYKGFRFHYAIKYDFVLLMIPMMMSEDVKNKDEKKNANR